MPSLPGSIAGEPEVAEGGGGVPVVSGGDELPTSGALCGKDGDAVVGGIGPGC